MTAAGEQSAAPSFFPSVIDLQGEGWIPQIVARYADPSVATVLEGVLTEAFRRGAKSAILEPQYIDRDYRSEYSAFYSTAFRQLPSVTDRLHFFEEPIPDEVSSPDEPATLDGLTYLGYTILRPVRAAPVGRTMIAPAKAKLQHITCLVRETVNVFGTDFVVEGVPFIAQDAHFGVCAHADAWMVAQYHNLRFRDSPRLTPASLALGGAMPKPRPIVEPGIPMPQMREMLQRAGLLPVPYDYKVAANKMNPHELAVRYLDSGIPVVLAADGHVVTAVGYRRRTRGLLRPRIQLIVHDDERGPYRQIGDSGIEYGDWSGMIVPLPEKVWLRAEQAETQATHFASLQLRNSDRGRHLLDKLRGKSLSWRTVCVESNEFKSTLLARGATKPVAVHYQRMPMPRWVWLVELVDINADAERAVIGEVLWDSTNHLRGGDVLAWRLADQFVYQASGREGLPIRINPDSALAVMQPKGRSW